MDIIAAHQQGLIEQLEEEVAALAGRARDHGQRAVVLHHLYDHSRGGHVWALAEARGALWLALSLKELERRIERWGWMAGDRDEARAALSLLAEALGQAGRARTAAAYRTYRMSATAALRGEAEAGLDPSLIAGLDQCHAARRCGDTLPADVQLILADESERLAASAMDQEALSQAWAAIDASGLRRPARRLLGDKAIARRARRDERRGWVRVECELRNDPALPASFRANPAQHFYALQRALQERQRRQWREACDREPDSFELAA